MALVSPSRWLHARAPTGTLVLARARAGLGWEATGLSAAKGADAHSARGQQAETMGGLLLRITD